MNQDKQQLLEAKWALFAMIAQFMYEIKDEHGEEYFYNRCESAGERAFDVLGFEDDQISKREFYARYDKLLDEIWELRGNEPRGWSYLQGYLDDMKR